MDFLRRDKAPRGKAVFLSGLERPVLPYGLPHDRLGISVIPSSGNVKCGPASYNNDEITSFTYQLHTHIESIKGFGARTGPQRHRIRRFQIPAPGHSQKDLAEPEWVKPSKKPFECGASRFPERKRHSFHPGPGSHEHNVPRNRQVQWHQSFGGRPILMPDITTKSAFASNTNKLESTKEERKFYNRLAYLKMYFD